MAIKDILDGNKKAKKKAAVKKTAKNVAIGAGIGSAIGLAAGILLAPESGKDTRKKIVKNAKVAAGKVKESVETIKDRIGSPSDKEEKKEEGCCCSGESNE